MLPIVAPSWRRRSTFISALLALLVGAGSLSPAAAQPAQVSKPILSPPPSQWDHAMFSGRPLLSQTLSDLTAITDGIVFGMGPGEVNAHMPSPAKGGDLERPAASDRVSGRRALFLDPVRRRSGFTGRRHGLQR